MEDKATKPSIGQLYQWWWLHDGFWYQEVARRFGFEAANEINKTVLKTLATRVARSVVKSYGKSFTEWHEVVDAYCKSAELMCPAEGLEFTSTITGPGTFKIEIFRNFALDALRKAGTLDKYDCPCLSLREGWFQGLGVHAVENRIEECMCKGGKACVFIGRVAEFAEAAQAPGAEVKNG